MGIHIESWDQDRIVYAKVPETVSDIAVENIKVDKAMNYDSKGWTSDRTMKKVGEVPFEVLYNYCLLKGIPVTQLSDFFSADNGKNMKLLLEEFSVFRTSNL